MHLEQIKKIIPEDYDNVLRVLFNIAESFLWNFGGDNKAYLVQIGDANSTFRIIGRAIGKMEQPRESNSLNAIAIIANNEELKGCEEVFDIGVLGFGSNNPMLIILRTGS